MTPPHPLPAVGPSGRHPPKGWTLGDCRDCGTPTETWPGGCGRCGGCQLTHAADRLAEATHHREQHLGQLDASRVGQRRAEHYVTAVLPRQRSPLHDETTRPNPRGNSNASPLPR